MLLPYFIWIRCEYMARSSWCCWAEISYLALSKLMSLSLLLFFHHHLLLPPFFLSFQFILNGKVIVYCEWKSYSCTPVPRLLNFKCHNAPLSALSTHKFIYHINFQHFHLRHRKFLLLVRVIQFCVYSKLICWAVRCACLFAQVKLNHFLIYFPENIPMNFPF